jgi:hypothetical protein
LRCPIKWQREEEPGEQAGAAEHAGFGARSRLRFYAPGIGHHVEHVRPTSVRLAPLAWSSAPYDTDA